MKYVYCPSEPRRYATDLRLDAVHGTLQWLCGRGQDVLIVRTPFGQAVEDQMEGLCRELGETDLAPGRFTELKRHIAVRRVSAVERVRENGCAPEGEACTYTVFACAAEGETCQVFAHGRQVMSSPRCDLPMRIAIGVFPVTRSRGFLRKTEEPTGYYRVTFPERCDRNYADGDLEYRIDDLAVPMTRRMFEAGEVFVKSATPPAVVSRKPGLELLSDAGKGRRFEP